MTKQTFAQKFVEFYSDYDNIRKISSIIQLTYIIDGKYLMCLTNQYKIKLFWKLKIIEYLI